MSRPGVVSRFSLTQLHAEDRKQRAHLKKIGEMQRQSQLDHRPPTRFPHLHQGFVRQLNDKHQEISKENQAKSKRLIGIMASTSEPRHTSNSPRQQFVLQSSHNHSEYLQRIAKAKGQYDRREWNKSFDEHRECQRLRKDNHVFTPLDIGVNRERLKSRSMILNSKRTTPTSSTVHLYPSSNREN